MKSSLQDVGKLVRLRLGPDYDGLAELQFTTFPQFVPATAELGYALGKILGALKISSRPFTPWAKYDALICFDDSTSWFFDIPAYVAHIRSGISYLEVRRLINAACADISKVRVAEIFEQVFGYSLDVDPRVYPGKMVRKSNLNAAHNGSVIQGPISEQEFQGMQKWNFVYNVYVDNVLGDMVEDIRIPFMGKLSEYCYRKHRPVATRFSNTNAMVYLDDTANVLSPDEARLVSTFCVNFGLEYGEIDCLRDRETGRIFIIDVNKTPAGPPNGLPDEDWGDAVANLAVSFAKGLLLPTA